MFQIISAAIAVLSLVAAYVAAWRIYRTAWDRKATAELDRPKATPTGALILLLRRRRRLKARYAGLGRTGASQGRKFAKA